MPVNIFCCYAHKDEALLNKLKTHLSSLQREGLIEIWHDRDISAGTEWEREISEHLNTAQVILLLVSPDFMNSDYCYGIEMQRALERHERGEACVIPVILEYVYWQIAPLNELQALPKDGQPVTSWSNRDKAFLDITRGIRKAIKELGKPTLVTSEYASRKSISRDTRGYPHIVHCPYRGLFAFQEEDEPFFFGRETFTQQLVNFVHQKLFVAVIGSSGSGKSSAVFAGLIPHLRREGSWLITSLRPGERPFHSLALSLMPLLEPQMSERERLLEGNELGQQLQESRLTLRDIVELIIQKQLGRRFLLVIDQFEELFTLCHEPEVREHFLDELAFIVQPTSKFAFSNFSLLLTLRVDFLGQVLDLHRPIADALQSSNLLLATMNAQELQDTIRKPAEALNMKIEEGLTERILQEVKPASNQLPLLEFALTLLWNKQKGGRLTHAGYVEIGGVEKALADHAEQVFTELSGDEQIQAQQVFIQLVYFGEGTENTRRLATRSEIGEENWKLVIHLSGAHARLVVNGRDQISGEETVEVVHEALISGWQRLREWIENNREFRTWQERLRAAIRLWEKSNRDDGALLRGFLLREAISWMAQDGENLSQKERTFIERSQQTFIERSQQAFIENSQQNEKRLSVLQRISGFSISIMNLDQTLEIIANAIAEELHTDLCSIFFYNELQRMLTLQATNGPRPLSGMPFTQRLGEGYSGWVADKGRPLLVFDALADPHFATEARTYSSEYHGLMSIPIIFFGNTERLIGVISVQSIEPRDFTKEEMSLVEIVAGIIAINIGNSRLYETADEQLQGKVLELAIIYRILSMIASMLNLDEVLQTITTQATHLTGVERSCIFELDAEKQELHALAYYGLNSDLARTLRIPVGQCCAGRTVTTGQPTMAVDCFHSDPHCFIHNDPLLSSNIHLVISMPLLARQKVLGCICLYGSRRHLLSAEQMQLVVTFANEAAIAIENSRLYEAARHALET